MKKIIFTIAMTMTTFANATPNASASEKECAPVRVFSYTCINQYEGTDFNLDRRDFVTCENGKNVSVESTLSADIDLEGAEILDVKLTKEPVHYIHRADEAKMRLFVSASFRNSKKSIRLQMTDELLRTDDGVDDPVNIAKFTVYNNQGQQIQESTALCLPNFN